MALIINSIQLNNVLFWKYLKSYFINEGECFIRVSKHEKTDESTKPTDDCFYCFRVFGNTKQVFTVRFLFPSSISMG